VVLLLLAIVVLNVAVVRSRTPRSTIRSTSTSTVLILGGPTKGVLINLAKHRLASIVGLPRGMLVCKAKHRLHHL